MPSGIERLRRVLLKGFRANVEPSHQAPRGAVVLHWYAGHPNWGDALNPVLASLISGRQVVRDAEVAFAPGVPRYSAIGSVLHNLRGKNIVVWGSGFITGTLSSADSRIKTRPEKVTAVRGPLTRAQLVRQGIPCPDVFGDPALLYPRYYQPAHKKTHKLGLIPHFIDQADPLVGLLGNQAGVTVIDILQSTNDVVDHALSCERIASSSLHGLILADAYGIPNVHVSFGERIKGDGFKFSDYFLSIGRRDSPPLRLSADVSVDELIDRCNTHALDIDLDKLLEVCPFGK